MFMMFGVPSILLPAMVHEEAPVCLFERHYPPVQFFPIDNLKSFLIAKESQSIHGGICRCQVSKLSVASAEAALWMLTSPQT